MTLIRYIARLSLPAAIVGLAACALVIGLDKVSYDAGVGGGSCVDEGGGWSNGGSCGVGGTGGTGNSGGGGCALYTDPLSSVATEACWRQLNAHGSVTFGYLGDSLRLAPTEAWQDSTEGLYVYKTITGPFIAETRLKLGSAAGEGGNATGTQNGGGLLVRDPHSACGAEAWMFVSLAVDGSGEREVRTSVTGHDHTGCAQSFVRFYEPDGTQRLRICRDNLDGYLHLYATRSDDPHWIERTPAAVAARVWPDTVQIGLAAERPSASGSMAARFFGFQLTTNFINCNDALLDAE